MKRTALFFATLFTGIGAIAQSSEFTTYSNGLIYSDGAMTKLSHVVDSLNLKFKSCDLNKKFYSKCQTIGDIIELEHADMKQVIADMEKQISMEEFIKKYPKAKVERNNLIIQHHYKNDDGKEEIEVEHFDLKTDYGFSITTTDVSRYNQSIKGTWLYEVYENNIRAFYFPENFMSIEIPHKYALMIGYSDCLIDTTTTKMKDDLANGWVDLPNNWMALPDSKKKQLLDEMRSTRVIGGCSQDSRPREHAINIALLSAETYNWEVFLKAHLDIMNDRFDRMSDGNYAWGARKTYIRELEELNINVYDLIMGISFRIKNPADNHYYGRIYRVGRALSETQHKTEIEAGLLSVITDKELDDYNRLLFFFLLKNYYYNLADQQEKNNCKQKLQEAAESFPDYYSSKLSPE